VSGPSLAGRTMAVTAIYLASAVFGLVRILVIATLFGASRDADAYVIASLIPFIVFELVTDGTLASAFVPVATRSEQEKGASVVPSLSGAFLVGVVLLGGILAGAVALAAPLLSTVLAPGFDAAGRDLVAGLLRIMTPAMFLSTTTGAIMAILFFRDRVVLSTANTLLFNVALVTSALALEPLYGIEAMAYGVVAGATVQLIAQVVMVRGLEPGTLGMPRRDPRTLESLGRVGLLILPLFGMTLVGYGSSLVNNMVASSLDPGSATAIHFAGRLVRLPAGVFAMAVSFVAFPRVARLTARGDLASSRSLVSKSLRYSLAVSIPGSVLLLVLSQYVVELLFHRGAFTTDDVVLTSRVLVVYAPAAVGFAVAEVMRRSSYALADTRTPLRYHLTVSLVQIPVMIGLVALLGAPGIPLATTLAVSINALLLVRRVGQALSMDWAAHLTAFSRVLAASAVCGVAAWAVSRTLGGAAEWSGLSALVPVTLGGVAGLAAFVAALRLLWPAGTLELYAAARGALRRGERG
jgi:putative peptidoglycan lipid II flippase